MFKLWLWNVRHIPFFNLLIIQREYSCVNTLNVISCRAACAHILIQLQHFLFKCHHLVHYYTHKAILATLTASTDDPTRLLSSSRFTSNQGNSFIHQAMVDSLRENPSNQQLINCSIYCNFQQHSHRNCEAREVVFSDTRFSFLFHILIFTVNTSAILIS